MLVALRVTAGATPVPVSVTVCGPPGRVLETVIAPLRTPVAKGLNAALMVQLARPARVAGLTGHVLPCVKSPLMAMLIVVAIAPLFLTVMGCVALMVPTIWLPKLKLLGETLTGGGVWFRRTRMEFCKSSRATSGVPSRLKSPIDGCQRKFP